MDTNEHLKENDVTSNGNIPEKSPPKQSMIQTFFKGFVSVFGMTPCSNLNYFLFIFGMYLQQLGHMMWYTLLVLRGVMAGETFTKASLLVTTLAAVAMVSRLVCGAVGDYIRQYRGHVSCLSTIANGALAVVSAAFTSYNFLLASAVGSGLLGCKYLRRNLI